MSQVGLRASVELLLGEEAAHQTCQGQMLPLLQGSCRNP